MTLFVMLLTAAAQAQTEYISEVMLIGKNNNTEANTLKAQYVAQGWTAIDKDLNDGCGSTTDYIYLLYKTRTTASPNHTFITDFYISDATGDAPESLSHDGHNYKLVPYDGDSHFMEKKGDLNSNAGGKDIHLYYTTERVASNEAITSITFNTTQSGAVGGYDLNKGAGGDDIYMHCESSKAPKWEINKSTDGGRCIVNGFDANVGIAKSAVFSFPAIIDGAVVIDIYGVDFSDFDNLETIYFSQDYTYTSMPVTFKSYFEHANVKHIHVVDNSGTVVNADALPASITSIPAYGFDGSLIETLTMPNVTSIGNNAFTACTALTSVTMPSVTNIGKKAFYGCSALPSISLPSCLTSIGADAFTGCTELTSVTLNSNPKFGANAFPSGTTVTMNLTANAAEGAKWTTFYNDRYNFQADANTMVYKGTVSGSSLVLTEVEDRIVNSGTAVILKSTANPVMTQTTTASTDTHDNDLRGRSERTEKSTLGTGTFYVMGKVNGEFGFFEYTGDYMPAGKAYVLVSGGGAPLRMVIEEEDDEATGIRDVKDVNGVNGDTWHSLDGRRLDGKPTDRGVYIHNGRKFIIK